jgi:aryl-alcohol dehydrogenase-like predicted oxidoreductase
VTRNRRLGRTDLDISPIGLGCMQMASRGMFRRVFPTMPQQRATEIVRTAMDGGINWFDTAEAYGNGQSERALSTALKNLDVQPGTVRIATKWLPVRRTAASIADTIEDRLDALQGYPIDLHQVHSPYGNLSSLDAQIDAMADLADAGRIRHVGVSNFNAAQLERAHLRLQARGQVLAANQVQISLLHRKIETNGVLATARRLGITLIGYSPLRLGILTGRFHDSPGSLGRLPRGRWLMMGGFQRGLLTRTQPLVDELRRIGDAHGVRPGQVALAWVITNYGNTVVCIPGASSPSQAAQSAEAMDLRLTPAELAALNARSRR